MSTDALRVSVVVPTYRRIDLLDRCLNALRSQTLPASDYEVIVCDDGPDQDVRDCVKRHAARQFGLQIRYVPVWRTQGPAGARNEGWRSARADVVAFTDDDTVPERQWLEAGLAALGPGLDAVAGRIVMPLGAHPSDQELDASHLQDAEFATANCLVRKEALRTVGGFDTRYVLAWREDSDLQFALLERGSGIGRADQAVVVHPLRPARFGAALRAQRKVRYDTLLYKKFPRLYRQRIRRGPPWFYLSICAFLLAAPVAWLAGAHSLALAAVLAWLALTLWSFYVRIRPTRKDLPHVAETLLTSCLIPPLSIFWRCVGSIAYRKGFP